MTDFEIRFRNNKNAKRNRWLTNFQPEWIDFSGRVWYDKFIKANAAIAEKSLKERNH